MMSVPGAVATGYWLTKLDVPANRDPVAIAPGTDCITADGPQAKTVAGFLFTINCRYHCAIPGGRSQSNVSQQTN
jgi:hypothetical protein